MPLPCAGPVIREDGKSRPITLDAIEQAHEQRVVDRMMESPGAWINLVGAAPAVVTRRCRCWTRQGNLAAAVIVPGAGRVDVRWCWMCPGHAALYERIINAHNASWKSQDGKAPTGKAFIDLSDADIAVLLEVAAKDKPAPMPTLRPITQRVRQIDLSKFQPPDKPAA